MKARHYIAAFALLAALFSCQRENLGVTPDESDGFVEVTFPVTFPDLLPAPTRAQWGEGPTDAEFDLYLAVYGPGDGSIQNWIKATEVSWTHDTQGYITGGTYKARLPMANDRRTIHLMANPPIDYDNPPHDMYMNELMEELVDHDGECTYWQEVVLDKITEDASSTAPLTSGVNLVRNFAKVVVKAKADQPFQVVTWTLMNVPDRGYVAPYIPNNKYVENAPSTYGERFPSSYLNDAILPLARATDFALFTSLVGTDEYPVYLPVETVIKGDATGSAEEFAEFPGYPEGEVPEGETASTLYVGSGEPLYMYERPKTEVGERPVAVLVKIQFDADADPITNPSEQPDDHSYWYKIEVLDSEGHYVPFYRDIVYRMEIAEVEEAGALTAVEAYGGVYYGNISASVETASLTDLSNTTSSIHVDQLDYTYVTRPDDGWITLMKDETNAAQYYFIPDLEHPQVYFASETGVCRITVDNPVAVSGYAAAVLETETLPNGGLRVKLAAQEEGVVKKSFIRVRGQALPNGKELYREITITLMETPDFVYGDSESFVEAPQGIDDSEKPVNITVYLPEGLGPSMFPVQVRIEAEQNSLTATDPRLPVGIGPSLFDPTRNTFYFIRTIKYSEYCWLNSKKKWSYNYEFKLNFYTSKSGDNNATQIKISEMNNRFNPKTLTLQ